jgi:triacylglycerol esterase/lipase EstA (alpha/beta hydrolase family)
MFNSLRADAEIPKKFQFWFFQYNSSNMITLSASELREAITDMIKRLDPQGEDPALQKMVVIGHSQGGLLTKMIAIDSGDLLWNAISDQPFDKADLEPKVKELAQRLVFIKPTPSVKRVVFISTPHRGSYLTRNWVRSLIRWVVTLPTNVVTGSREFLDTLQSRLKLPEYLKGEIPTSIDGMSDANPLLKSLVTIPLAPGIVGHSIIAVKPGMDIETGNDGVVEYKSAHIDNVESEYIVRAGHSCQDHPLVVEEVRRILLKHLQQEADIPPPVETSSTDETVRKAAGL